MTSGGRLGVSRAVRSLLVALGSLSVAAACTDVSRFDTGTSGAYCGSIVSGSFVREGFSEDLRLRLTLDTDHFDTLPGTLTTDDAEAGACEPGREFDAAPLRTVEKVVEDPLSILRFDDAQERNLLAYVDSECRGTLLAVVSLLRDDDVDVRLLRPAPLRDDGTADTAFGVFHLTRNDCTFDSADE